MNGVCACGTVLGCREVKPGQHAAVEMSAPAGLHTRYDDSDALPLTALGTVVCHLKASLL